MSDRAYVLLTAMPPTKGHLRLIQFAAALGESAEVVLATQPDEPFFKERLDALRRATRGMDVNIHHIHQPLPQEPEEADNFWEMWLGFLLMFGLEKSDYIVASEKYGAKLAEISGAQFIPYDMARDIYPAKATIVREHPRTQFEWILPEFQPFIRKTVTLFGAESTGKTTLSKDLARSINGHWLPEWARPYMEFVGPEVNDHVMRTIWNAQRALQASGQKMLDKPFVVQDTDLFTTIGFWENWDGKSHEFRGHTATLLKSDLYLITASNIPFAPDPLRFGGDKRETSDQYWIDLAEKWELNYVVIDGATHWQRLGQAVNAAIDLFDTTHGLTYQRRGNDRT